MNSLEQDAPMELTDGEYVRRSRNGSPEDFRLLVERYQRPLFAYCVSRLNSTLEAEETAQEAFVRAFVSLPKLRQPESFYAWLLGIAGRVLKEQWRANRRHQREREAAEQEAAETQSIHSKELAPDDSLETAIASLPETYRRIVLLRYYEGHSCHEIAECLGVPLGTVTKTLSRAYGLLREQLKDEEGQHQTKPTP